MQINTKGMPWKRRGGRKHRMTNLRLMFAETLKITEEMERKVEDYFSKEYKLFPIDIPAPTPPKVTSINPLDPRLWKNHSNLPVESSKVHKAPVSKPGVRIYGKNKFSCPLPLRWTSNGTERPHCKQSLKHREDFLRKLERKHFQKLKARHGKAVLARKLLIEQLPVVRITEILEKVDSYKIV